MCICVERTNPEAEIWKLLWRWERNSALESMPMLYVLWWEPKGSCTFFRQIHVARQSPKNLLNLLGMLFFHVRDPAHSNSAIPCVQKLFAAFWSLPVSVSSASCVQMWLPTCFCGFLHCSLVGAQAVKGLVASSDWAVCHICTPVSGGGFNPSNSLRDNPLTNPVKCCYWFLFCLCIPAIQLNLKRLQLSSGNLGNSELLN